MTEVSTALATVRGWTGEQTPRWPFLFYSLTHTLTHTYTHTHQHFLKVCDVLSSIWASRPWHTWGAGSGTGGCVWSVFGVYVHACVRQCLRVTALHELPESKVCPWQGCQKKLKRKFSSFNTFDVSSLCHAVIIFNGFHSILNGLPWLSSHGASHSFNISNCFTKLTLWNLSHYVCLFRSML